MEARTRGEDLTGEVIEEEVAEVEGIEEDLIYTLVISTKKVMGKKKIMMML